ncbi:MAG TPA: hypothetical protein VMW19_18755 [Myxococcota bacterium]|nr:hypothetical protein [Myxococcota bacterium]
MIEGQRYDSSGARVGGEFTVATEVLGPMPNQATRPTAPSVASDPDGNFIVVWDETDFTSGPNTYRVLAQRYDSSGSVVGGPFQVNTTDRMEFDGTSPSIATGPDGNFVVVWDSATSLGSDNSGTSVQAQRFDSSGAALGTQFQVNTYTRNGQDHPRVASDAAGDFVVVWQSYGTGPSHQYSIQGQRYSSSGSALGAQFQVNTYMTGGTVTPWVASGYGGNFVVVWLAQGTAPQSIRGQRYDSSGSPRDAEFQVNTYTSGSPAPQPPQVASDSAGAFAVVWESASPGTDTSQGSVQGRLYAANGSALGDQFQVNTYTTGDQGFPTVATDGGENLIIVWGNYPGNPAHPTIEAQRYLPEPSYVSGVGATLAMLCVLARRRGR